MTFTEFQEQGLDCDDCPIKKAQLCGFATCREFNSDPPCSFADGEQDMNDWIKDKNEQIRRIEDYESKKIREQKRKKEIARKRAETTRQMKIFCSTERKEIARLEKAIKALTKTINTAQSMVFAFNSTNEMFGYSERKQVNPELTIQLDDLKEQLKIAKEKYKIMRKEFYAQKRVKGN